MWEEFLSELGRRGDGVRESGAFLLAPPQWRSRRTVHRVVYFDDVDPESLTGAITIRSGAFDALWTICAAEKMRVIADVHTHPSTWVHQSETDRTNPMIATTGHVAIIIPDFATRRISPSECGVHTYRGAHEWDSATGAEASRALYVGRWA